MGKRGKDCATEIREWKENGVLKGPGGDLKEEEVVQCQGSQGGQHKCTSTHTYGGTHTHTLVFARPKQKHFNGRVEQYIWQKGKNKH